ncbi:MAG: hypothetical protein ABL933_13635 [Methyloglobulus sp.]|nr:hypothetical protein [Methyloglobulus sp.]
MPIAIRFQHISGGFLRKQILALLMLVPALVFAESVVEVISVYNRPASEIQPLLLPMLEESDHIVANGDTLIVKTTPERLATITKLIGKLDSPLTNLQISVIQSQETTAEQLNAGVRFDVAVPWQRLDHTKSRGDAYYNQSRGNNTNKNTQIIRTTDGATAYIKAGSVVPITNYQVYRDGYGYPYENRSTQLVEATTGFAVTPKLIGEQVNLEVSPWSDHYSGKGQFQTQSAETSIRVNLGEWVDLGGVAETGQSSNNGGLNYNQQFSQNNLHILVKVDIVN